MFILSLRGESEHYRARAVTTHQARMNLAHGIKKNRRIDFNVILKVIQRLNPSLSPFY